MKKYLRISIFIFASIIFYLIWNMGGEKIYSKLVITGIEKFTSKISSIESAEQKYLPIQNETILSCQYHDRTTNIALDFCLPVVLLFAWQFSLFFDFRISKKTALYFFLLNFIIIYTLQILFPLLLYNISLSKFKSMGLFIGLQIFGFLVFFLILKDSYLIKYKFRDKQDLKSEKI